VYANTMDKKEFTLHKITKTGLLYILFIFSPIAVADEALPNSPFSWDLSYTTIFSENEVPKKDTMRKYFIDAYNKQGNLKEMHLPDKMFSDIDLAKVKTAILIDYQVFWFFGHRMVTLYLDDGQSVVARSYDTKSREVKHFKVRPDYFTTFSADILNRSQSEPAGGYSFKVAKGYLFAGYIGVISHYSMAGTSQQLITVEDLKSKDTGPGELGKMIMAMQKKMKQIYDDN